MFISGYKANNYIGCSRNINLENKLSLNAGISFSGKPKYKVANSSLIQKIIPTIAFAGSVIGALGYMLGGIGLYYDLYHENKLEKFNKNKNSEKTVFDSIKGKKNRKSVNDNEGVKTITTCTDFGKFGMTCAKTAVAATAVAGITCGIGEGIPLMTLGEISNISSAKIIETPVGTGLFGIGIASIFAGLALDNTPHLKLNEFDLLAAKTKREKITLIAHNIIDASKEVVSSVADIAKQALRADFWKNNVLSITPKNIVFSEEINKDGKITISRTLRHRKNYLMHAASFTLAMGGLGIIISSALDMKKVQRKSLEVEEGGFLFDNLGMTKYGIDKYTSGGKFAGINYTIAGIANAISQFMGLDNKDGRALQWLGISAVFFGYAIDRGKHLKQSILNSKFRPELTRVVREWSVDLTKITNDENELKGILKEIKNTSPDEPIKNHKVAEIEDAIKNNICYTNKTGKIGINFDTNTVKKAIKDSISSKFDSKSARIINNNILGKNIVEDYQSAQETLKICTKKIFGHDDLNKIESIP